MKAIGTKILFGLFFLGLGLLIAKAPLAVATISVGFLAAPHNWMEIRYIIGRLPGKLGKLRTYFWTSIIGIGLLGLSSFSLPFFFSDIAYSVWNTLLVLWVTRLAQLRSQEHPRRSWPWLEPLALLVLALIWAYPMIFTLALVLGHPIMAILILGRELHAFRRPELATYRIFVIAVAIGAMGLLASLFLDASTSAGEIGSFMRVSADTPLFIAIHAYLELVHYMIWIGILPWLASATGRGSLKMMPALRKSALRLWGARLLLMGGACLAVLFWWGFHTNYYLAYSLYFQIAIFHVLVEFPFVLRTA